MKILDPGHTYLLDSIDGGAPQTLVFVKREGDKFPFNYGCHPGTNVQEVLRALIDRTQFLNSQQPCAETEAAIGNLRTTLLLFELRAARCHGRHLNLFSTANLMHETPCQTCGHIRCEGHNVSQPQPQGTELVQQPKYFRRGQDSRGIIHVWFPLRKDNPNAWYPLCNGHHALPEKEIRTLAGLITDRTLCQLCEYDVRIRGALMAGITHPHERPYNPET